MKVVARTKEHAEKKQQLIRLFDAFFLHLKEYFIVIDSDGVFFDGLSKQRLTLNLVRLILRRAYEEKFTNRDFDVVVAAIVRMMQKEQIDMVSEDINDTFARVQALAEGRER